jgi:hypothetical protein
MRGAPNSCEPFRRRPIAPLSRSAHRPNASTHRRYHPRPRCACQTCQQPAISPSTPQSVRRSTHLTALRLTSAPPDTVAAALHRPRLRSNHHRMRSCPQRGVILRLATVRAPAAPAARPRSPQSRARNFISSQARAQHQHRLANRSSAQADADVAVLRVRPATPRAVSAARAGRQAADAPVSPAHHRPPPDRRSAAVQALRSFNGVAVSPACKPQRCPSASCARAARAPGTTSPRGDAPTPPQAHIAPHHPPTPHATHAHQPPPPQPATTDSPLRASPMGSMCVCLRSHALSNPSGTALACPTLTGALSPEPPATQSAVSTPCASCQAAYAPLSRADRPEAHEGRPAAVQALRHPRGACCQPACLPLRSSCVLLARRVRVLALTRMRPWRHARRDALGTGAVVYCADLARCSRNTTREDAGTRCSVCAIHAHKSRRSRHAGIRAPLSPVRPNPCGAMHLAGSADSGTPASRQRCTSAACGKQAGWARAEEASVLSQLTPTQSASQSPPRQQQPAPRWPC